MSGETTTRLVGLLRAGNVVVFFAALVALHVFFIRTYRRQVKPERMPPAAAAPPPRHSLGSLAGILLQFLAFFAATLGHRPATQFFVSGGGPELEIALQFLATAFLVGGLSFAVVAIRALGRQWSIMARLTTDHELVTHGPFALVRHPIYAGILATLIAYCLAWSEPITAAIAILLYFFGTRLRTTAEERLLAAKFGSQFREWKANTGALLPRLRRRARLV